MEPVFPMPEPEPEPAAVGRDVAQLLELLQEGQERKEHLLRIQAELAEVKRKTLPYVAELEGQRRRLIQTVAEETHRANTALTRLCIMHEQLRKLVAVCDDVLTEEGWPNNNTLFADALQESRELLTACEPYLK